ncbi:pyridoxamine 5'-phosphate oxidase family protein [Couchioplanes azureus]|uniref:pyridoxamine 5'-phosphate oxidase family protein n=1 Tax=Couchioplanes caeruleus TaxID=56438 RepID=UPI0016716504|nr:pyridoxamine 5'-phosphate oxidase family protein [Couchioplanes caeruleus]GGQ72902.1 PPOX class F420-dependent enzyme [Couchioplanes caeruleus subsp. azureus]
MNQRTAVRMPAGEVAALLAAGHKLQVATINPDGTPHLVTMFYGLRDARIAFWTYRTSQKARNLARDPRLSCLVEDGDGYFELRGVQVTGVVRTVRDLAGITEIGRLVAARMPGGPPSGALEEYVERAARKRVAYLVEPRRTVSWDHRRLLT